LAEAVDIIQGLLAGTLRNYRGTYFVLDNARLFDRPHVKPPIVIAAGGPRAARIAARKGDGVIATEPRADLVEAFISTGGSGPRYAEVAMCYGTQEEEAQQTAHRYFRWSITGWPVTAELPDTDSFASATRHVSPETVAQQVSCGPSAERHLQAIDRYLQADYDHIILTQIAQTRKSSLNSSSGSWHPICEKRPRLVLRSNGRFTSSSGPGLRHGRA
jgi:G6PDH family F420-dependent oxidoreductase